jgi:hypothetical protein
MLITVLALIAIFFIARSLMLRYTGRIKLANVVSGAILIAFLAGFILHAIAFPNHENTVTASPPASSPPAPPSTQPSAAAIPGKAISPANRSLDRAQLDGLHRAGGAVPYSYIESLGGTGPSGDEFPNGAKIAIHGWAGDPATKSTASGLLMIVDGRRRIDIVSGYGGDRIDVARAFNTMGMLHSNFVAILPTAGLAKGVHHFELAVITRDGRHYRIVTSPPKAFTID